MRYKCPVAVHLLLLKDDEILLLRRFNTGYEDGNYSLIAGHLDGNETYREAMIREAYEEAGIQVSPDHLIPIQIMHRRSDEERLDYFFTARQWSGQVENREPDKCDALHWFPIHQLPDNMVAYVRAAIENYQDNITFTDFGW